MQCSQKPDSNDDDCIEIKSEPADTLSAVPVHIFTCAHCGSKFKEAGEFEQHVMSHKTYLCCFCDTPFTDKQQLLEHLQTHEVFSNKLVARSDTAGLATPIQSIDSRNAKQGVGSDGDTASPKPERSAFTGKFGGNGKQRSSVKSASDVKNARRSAPKRKIFQRKSNDVKQEQAGDSVNPLTMPKRIPSLVEYALECGNSTTDPTCDANDDHYNIQDSQSPLESVVNIVTSMTDTSFTQPDAQMKSKDSSLQDGTFTEEDDISGSQKEEKASCDVCEQPFTSLRALSDHWHQCHSEDVMHLCYECYRAFDTVDSLQEHRELCNHVFFICHICSEKFIKQMELKEHLSIHRTKNEDNSARWSGDNPLACNVCSKSFSSRALCRVHIRRQHGSTKFTCSVCGQRFVRRDKLRKHELTHSSGFRCIPCNESFDERWKLSQHRKQHVVDRSFQCSLCPMSFATAGNLHRHQEVHSDTRPHVCDVCSKSFKRLNHLKRHQLGHLETKPYPCHLCDKSFVRKPHLERHILIHTRKWQCKECPEILDSRSALSDHVTSTHHEQLHVCEHCGVTFAQRSYWRKHLKNVHNKGDPRFSCPSCPKEFFSRPDLAKHLRVHTGEKPFACPSCDKAFSQAGALIRHKRIHTGERPYLCSTCGRSFADQSHYKRHLKIHAIGRAMRKRSTISPQAPTQSAWTAKQNPTEQQSAKHHSIDVQSGKYDSIGLQAAKHDSIDLQSAKLDSNLQATRHDSLELQPANNVKHVDSVGLQQLKHLAAAADLYEMSHRPAIVSSQPPLEQPVIQPPGVEETAGMVDQGFTQTRLLQHTAAPTQYTGPSLPFVFPPWQHK